MEWNELEPSFWDHEIRMSANNDKMAIAIVLKNDGKSPFYVCVFISQDGTLHLLIEPEKPMKENLIDPKAAGLNLKILPNHLVSGRDRQNYIDLQCAAKPHAATFTELVKDIAAKILRDGIDPSSAVNTIIRRWKSFWGKPVTNILSETEQLGLLGELLVLETLLKSNYPEAMVAWRGPYGEIHDFNFTNNFIEVKATTRSFHRHIINGIEQLETRNKQRLVLISFTATSTINVGINLSSKVKEICSMLIDRPDIFELFNDGLAVAGFRYEHSEVYERSQFNFKEGRVFHINEDFPRFTQSSLSNPLSPRISEIRYLLDLEGLTYLLMESKGFLDFISA